MTRPGTQLRRLAQRIFDASTMERLIDPVVADLQCEHAYAVQQSQAWRSRWVLVSGYIAFWKVVTISLGRTSTGALTRPHDGAVGRTIRFSGLATMVVTLLLIWPPQYYYSPYTIGHRLLMICFSLPGVLFMALPVGLVFGVMSGFRGHVQTRRSQLGITLLILATCLATIVIAGWILPASNNAFRELMSGRRIMRGVNELTLSQLWQLSRDRFIIPVIKSRRTFDFNFRLAPAIAPLALGLFALGVATARRRASSVPVIGLIALVSCFSYYWLLYWAHLYWVSWDRLYWARTDIAIGRVIFATWGPNLVFLASALLLWMIRRREPSAADPSHLGDDLRSEHRPVVPQA